MYSTIAQCLIIVKEINTELNNVIGSKDLEYHCCLNPMLINGSEVGYILPGSPVLNRNIPNILDTEETFQI